MILVFVKLMNMFYSLINGVFLSSPSRGFSKFEVWFVVLDHIAKSDDFL